MHATPILLEGKDITSDHEVNINGKWLPVTGFTALFFTCLSSDGTQSAHPIDGEYAVREKPKFKAPTRAEIIYEELRREEDGSCDPRFRTPLWPKDLAKRIDKALPKEDLVFGDAPHQLSLVHIDGAVNALCSCQGFRDCDDESFNILTKWQAHVAIADPGGPCTRTEGTDFWPITRKWTGE